MEIIFATANKHKLMEAQAIVGSEFKLVTPSELGITEDIEETGTTLKENALIKAQYLWDKFHRPCFADDTGLEIEALNGRPGVFSARYAGEGCNFKDNMDKVLTEMADSENRNARFRTVISLIIDGIPHFFEGEVKGTILREQKGTGGFGYDPIFLPEGESRTMSELSEIEKNNISHRGVAIRKLSDFLKAK
ncbi:MAG: RdgB/HAM1 family non-canonical purine NTP pyrophosphatase [Thiovulaceae bacterium]|nr:RdgB/HAM1 family non-canonical purine NTP pyrophosphatase [Sulfurimonadaceae bacterium]